MIIVFFFHFESEVAHQHWESLLKTSCDRVFQEKVSALETQSDQLSLQASQECERLHSDRTHTLQMLQKVLTESTLKSNLN